MSDSTQTITVQGTFKEKQVTREEFIQRWSDHARGLHQLDWDCLEELQQITHRIEEIAGEKFDKAVCFEASQQHG